jgi:hypothetical protein
VPELSRFRGIVITMYPEPGIPHHNQHFHARYAESKAVYGIAPVALISGWMPGPQEALVVEWAEQHQSELKENWARLQRGERALPIDALP